MGKSSLYYNKKSAAVVATGRKMWYNKREVMGMEEKNDVQRRKELRIKQYDYSSKGAYFVTICIQGRKRILSDIIPLVGGGALDALSEPQLLIASSEGLDDPFLPQIRLSEIGKIVEKNLLSSENIAGVTIDRYVIMPDHIHVIIFLDPDKYIKDPVRSSRAPTPTNEMLPHIISTFKRFCHKEIGDKIFQRGYMEHIVRDRDDYETRVKYIYENSLRWYYDELYADE